MKFTVEHELEAGPEAVAAVLLDESFQASLADIGPLRERELLGQEERDGLVVRRIRCVLDIQVTGAARRFLGSSDPAWVEEATWHPDELAWRWTIHPEVAGDLLQARGEILILPTPAAEDHALRTVTGDVKVRVPLYGSRVEGWIVEGLEDAYAEEAERLAQWLG